VVARRGRDQAGKVRMGCLFTLLVTAVFVYYGIQFLEVRIRYFQIQDEVKTQAAFAPALSNDVILRRLVARADSLGLPLGPRRWTIRRANDPRSITIQAEYEDSVVIELPGWRKVWRFTFRPGTTNLY
jgi:hypothetical protein